VQQVSCSLNFHVSPFRIRLFLSFSYHITTIILVSKASYLNLYHILQDCTIPKKVSLGRPSEAFEPKGISTLARFDLYGKLNNKKLRWVLKELRNENRELSVYTIAKRCGITPQWARRLRIKYAGVPTNKVQLERRGKKPILISSQEVEMVRRTKERYDNGACKYHYRTFLLKTA
jgi:hypothetical protein